MKNIFDMRADIWCYRLDDLMKSRGYTQKTFLKEYKCKYGNGTQANVSRWLHVGNMIQKNGTSKKIGFPSYENMLKIADFFGVTVGYLTGETDFETFEMEKACQCIGIDEETGKALRNILHGNGIQFRCYQKEEISAILRYLFTSDSFPRFINGLQKYADSIYQKKYPKNHIVNAEKKIKKELIDLAFQCIEYQQDIDEQYGAINDFAENNVEPNEDLLKAISRLNEAIDQNYTDEVSIKNIVTLSEYELQKIYFELIKEVIADDHLPEMVIPYGEEGNHK